MPDQPNLGTMSPAKRKRPESNGPPKKPPLAEQSILDLDGYLRDQQGLTYLLYANDEDGSPAYSSKPDPITALGLIPAALGWQEFRSHVSPASIDRTALAIGVQRRVQEMMRRDCEFGLFWHIAGDQTVNFQSSRQYGFVTLDDRRSRY